MRWHVAIVEIVVAEVAAFMAGASACRGLHHALLHNGKALSILELAFFSGHLFPSAAVCRADPRRHYPLPSSKSEGAAFFLSGPHGPYFLFGEAGEVPAVPELLMRPPHRGRWQNEVAVVRFQGPPTFPGLQSSCLSVSPYGRDARRGSLWCSFSAVASPSWSTEF